jgi:DNA-binding CsgD family transcriptional regulator/DNA polymerase III delta prime subunit
MTAAGHASSAAGRDAVRERLAAAVDAASARGTAVLLVGEPGSGKTTTLGVVSDLCRSGEFAVLTATGWESESSYSFATLAGLLAPILPLAKTLSPRRKAALEVALGLAEGVGAGSVDVAAAALDLVSAAAASAPVGLLVDDLQWVDPESRHALEFIVRRIADERVLAVFTAREDPLHDPRLDGATRIELEPLTLAEARSLATKLGVGWDPERGRRWLDASGGNPLVLTELLKSGTEVGFGAGRLPGTLERTWGELWAGLSERTRLALFVAAADEASQGRHVRGALEHLSLDSRDLAAAEYLGILDSTGGWPRLRHPLMRSVARERTSLADRTTAFRALADVAADPERAWFVAAAGDQPSDIVIEGLRRAAAMSRAANGFVTAARTLHRAAQFSANGEERASLLLAASTDAFYGGDFALGNELCNSALAETQDPRTYARAAGLACVLGTGVGDGSHTVAVTRAAADRIRDSDPLLAAQTIIQGTLPAASADDLPSMKRCVDDALQLFERAEPPAYPDLPTTALISQALVMTGDLHRAQPHLDQVMQDAARGALDLQSLAFLAQSLVWSERLTEARTLADLAVAFARRAGAPIPLMTALSAASDVSWWTGEWTRGYAEAAAAIAWAEESGAQGIVGFPLAMIIRFDAAMGNPALLRERLDRMKTDVESRGVLGLRTHAAASAGLGALSAGDPTAAVPHLMWAFTHSTQQGLGNDDVVPQATDAAYALARAGRADEALDVARRLEERAASTGLRIPLQAAARVSGLLATDTAKSERRFGEALELASEVAAPYERARTLLALGMRRRRDQRPSAARRPLEEAIAIFDHLGAMPWRAFAAAELAASGGRMPPAAPTPLTSTLSHQEIHIARATADGLSNAEVAETLFLSVKTVEAHLTRIYRKLGIRSRTELTRIVAASGAPQWRLGDKATAARIGDI